MKKETLGVVDKPMQLFYVCDTFGLESILRHRESGLLEQVILYLNDYVCKASE